jgi:sensor histidine kinase YesM
VRVSAHRAGDVLELTVEDDGPGPGDAPFVTPSGRGLANTQERLRTLYGDRASVTIVSRRSRGAIARLRLPYHELPLEVRRDAQA